MTHALYASAIRRNQDGTEDVELREPLTRTSDPKEPEPDWCAECGRPTKLCRCVKKVDAPDPA